MQCIRLFERAVERGLDRRSLDNIEHVGVDEKSFGKALGSVGYFRVDLGLGDGPVLFLDGEVAVADDNGMNDFTITIPDVDVVLRGDVNLDGLVNFLDIAPFISRLTEMENQPEADVNEDGIVNLSLIHI